MAEKITLDPDDAALAAKLQAFDAAASDLAPLYAVIGNKILNRVRLCFKLGIDPWGQPWQQIKFRAPAVRVVQGPGGDKPKRRADGSLVLTAKGKAQVKANEAGKPGQPLRDTGQLQRSITAEADASGVTIGTNLKRARLHQFGGTIVPKSAKVLAFPGPNGEMIFAKRVTVPARPYLPLRRGTPAAVDLPPSWAAMISADLSAYLRRAFKEA